MNKMQKVIAGTVVSVMLLTASAGAAFAQDDTAQEGTIFSVCERPELGERSTPLQDALAEAGITRGDFQDFDGTFEEFLAENGIDVEAIRSELEAQREERKAEREATLLDCVSAAQEAGIITAEQATAITDAVENGTLRELIQSEEFEDLFPNRGDRDGRRGNGRRGGGRFGGFGDFGGDNTPDAEATEQADA